MCPSQRTLPGKYDTRDMGVNHIVYTVSKYAFRPQKELHFAKKNDVKERITTTPAGDQVDKGVGNIQK